MGVKSTDDFYGTKTGPHLTVKPLMTQADTISLNTARNFTGSGKRRTVALKIDMTPMVDLGFLLISFFVMTAELSRPSALQLVLPKEEGPQMDLGDSYALTILLDGDKNYCYEGRWSGAIKEEKIRPVTTGGVRDLIIQKQQDLDDRKRFREGRDGLMLLIKPSGMANYDEIISMLDEAFIGRVKKYSIGKLSGEELQWLRDHE